jgi:asparagine synthase (glutamine-hydrolysing)
MTAIIAVLNKKGKNATQTANTMLKTLSLEKAKTFAIASPTTVRTEKNAESLQHSRIDSPTIVGIALSETLETNKPQPIKLKDTALAFSGIIYTADPRFSDSEAFPRKIQKNPEKAIKWLMTKTDSDFAFALVKAEELIVGRDALGTQPLYYGENTEWTALASQRKALWKIGINNETSFPPGNVAIVTKDGFQFKSLKKLAYPNPKPIIMQSAAKKLYTLLQQSIRNRITGIKEIALAFSGGLDSTVIAAMAKKLGANVHLIHVSLKNQKETEHATKIAQELDLPIHVQLYTENDVEKTLRKVLWIIEEANPLKTSIGIPIYWTAEKASQMGFKALLAGQGADELFGGYEKHVQTYLQHGNEKAQETIFKDIVEMYEANFERDSKICSFHGIDLRLPFATYAIAKFAVDLPIELKMERSPTTLRKLVLRQLAKNVRLPTLATEKPKKAIQYTTGITKALKKLAKRNNLTLNEYFDRAFQTLKDENL